MSSKSHLAAALRGALSVTAFAVASLAGVTPAHAASAQDVRAQKTAQIPVCSRNLGTLAVVEPDGNWWGGAQLPSPAALIKVFVSRSHCFTLLDRGKGMHAMQAERELAANGDLRGGSNVGKGQIKAADYVLVPDLISQNNDASGNNIGGLIGGLVHNNNVGALLGGVNIKKKTADVVLTVTDVRSSEQVAMTEGHASKTDIGWAGGVGVFWGAFAGAGASGYANTEIGQVITLAYLQAYTDMVAQLGGLPANASVANAPQAVAMQKPGRLFTAPDGAHVVRPLEPGMLLYPTGNKQGVMWEVEDELGNTGWVSSLLVDLAR
jgi:curli biogenesis system outer membrane secretion channel CsgG